VTEGHAAAGELRQRGFGDLGDRVQFQVELVMPPITQFGHLCLQVGNPPPKPCHLRYEGLIRAIAYVPEQSARHVGDPSRHFSL
jgi:hypothetical protein